MIRRKARRLVGKAGFTKCDVDDVAQELALKLLQRAPSFDAEQSHWNAFVVTVVERCAASLLRDKRAEKRDHRRVCSLSSIVGHDKKAPVELGATLSQRESDARCNRESMTDLELTQLATDISSALEHAPVALQKLAGLLKSHTVSATARELGVPRTTLYEAIRHLRRRFESAGLKGYL
jgi:RNA polymerase sigma-70 factor (ECF subfamily)